MKILTAKEFKIIRDWVYRHARPLDLARWQYHFENDSKDNVLLALAAYQNRDGGFGHALEADSWNPDSSPAVAVAAIHILKEIDFLDGSHQIIKELLVYLESAMCVEGCFWSFTIPSNNQNPRAPWWTHMEGEGAYPWGYNPAAAIVGFILRTADAGSSLYDTAVGMAEQMIAKLFSKARLEMHELDCYLSLFEDLKYLSPDIKFDIAAINDELFKRISAMIEKNPDKWNEYGIKPSFYITSPDSIGYAGNEKVIELEINYLLETRNKDGVWDINWQWGDYPEEFAIAAMWWQSDIVIKNVRLLQNFNRLEF